MIQDLDDLKAVNTRVINISKHTTIAEFMVIATGNSNRHVGAIADNLLRNMKKRGLKPVIEKDEDKEWVLVDLGDIVIHIMQPIARDFYNLEKLWSMQDSLEAEFLE